MVRAGFAHEKALTPHFFIFGSGVKKDPSRLKKGGQEWDAFACLLSLIERGCGPFYFAMSP